MGFLRDKAILALPTETDLRPDEARNLTMGDYDRAFARLELGPERLVLLNGYAVGALEEYLEVLCVCARPVESSPLFVTAGMGGPLPENHCWDLIRYEMRLADPASAASLP